MLNVHIEKLLNEKLGQPTRKVKKVSAWTLSENSDLVLETNFKDGANSSNANLWLPAIFASKCSDLNLILYPIGKGRHSNTYSSKGLEKDKAAIKVKLSNLVDANRLLGAIQS